MSTTRSDLAAEERPSSGLHHGRLGVLGIVFFVVAAAAPLVGMTGGVPVSIVVGNGAGAPGTFLVVGIILLLFSVGYGAMSSRVTNTGAFFAYVGRGLGPIAGVGSAFVSLVAYIGVQLAIYGFFGAVAAQEMADKIGISWDWWAWALLSWAVVTALSVLSIDVGAKVLGVLMSVELLCLLVTSIAVFAAGGADGLDFGASFAPQNVFAGGLASTAGISLVFAFASFIGFEATAIYGEEAKDPHRTVPRATYVAVLAITGIFALTSFAIVSGLGASEVVDKTVALSSVDGVPLVNPAAVLFSVADDNVGSWMSDVMSWLVLSSLFAGLLAFQNSAARYLFALGRAQVLPRALARVNGRGAPWLATLVTSVVTLAIIVIFWWGDRDPVLNLFFWFSGLAVIAIVLVEILVSLAVIVYFGRNRGEVGAWTSTVAPVLSIIGLGLGLWLLTSRFGLLAGTVKEGVDPSTQAWGLNATGWLLVLAPFATLVVGAIVGRLRVNSENEQAVADLVS